MPSFKTAARASELAQHRAQIHTLQTQLAAERRAHERTIRSLGAARGSHARPHTPLLAKAGKRTDGDMIEVIFGDVHGNKNDPAAVSALLRDIKTLNPHRIFIGGDFIDCGGFLAEHHTLGYVAETDDSYEEDVAAANRILDAIQRAAPRAQIHYLEGNHEWRVERWVLTQRLAHSKDIDLLRRTFAAEHVLHLNERGIKYYRQGHVHTDCGVPGWVKMDRLFYVHKISNAADAAAVAIAKAAGNVVYFDTHRASFKPAHIPGVGLISAWNPGCLCLRQPLYRNTIPTEWTHGYLVRFISRKSRCFQMMNVAINEGVSYGGLMLGAIGPGGSK